jgi:hypothetical protein
VYDKTPLEKQTIKVTVVNLTRWFSFRRRDCFSTPGRGSQ